MASTVPPGVAQHQSQPSSNDAPLSWEGDKMFNIYIYDYCFKRGFKKTAHELQQEAELSPDAKPPINARQGLLFEWWSVFWVLFSAKAHNNGTEDAMLYTQHQANQAMQRLQQQRMQPPGQGPLPGPPAGQPGGPQQPPVQRMMNGPMAQRLGASFPMNGPMPNGVISAPLQPGQMPPGPVAFPNLGGSGPQPNGIPGSGPPQTPGSTPAPTQNFASLLPNQRPIGAPGGPQQSPQPPQPLQQQRQNGPFQPSPTITNSPQVGIPGQPQQQQSTPQQQSQQPPQHHAQPPPSMGQLGVAGSSPHMQHLNRSMPPPHGFSTLNPQQAGSTPTPSFAQLGRPPSRTNTPGGQGSMMQPSPSLSARQAPGNAMNQDIMELRQIPHQIFSMLKQELGIDRDISQMTPAERLRLLATYRQRRSQKPDGMGLSAGLQPPNTQPRGLPPQQQPQQPPPRLKRSSTTPEEHHEGIRTDSSPPQKRPRPSPEQPPMQGMGYPSQQPQGPPGGLHPGQQSNIPMPGQNPLTMMRGQTQIGGPISGGAPQGGQPAMMNMNLGQTALIGGVALNPHGHPGQSGLMAQQMQFRQIQTLQAHTLQGLKGPMPPQGMNPTIQGPGNNAAPSSTDPTMHPGPPGASSGPQFNRLSSQNKSMGMMPPAQNGVNKDQGGNKDIKTEDVPRNIGGNAGHTPNASGTAPPTPAPGVTNVPTNQGTQGPAPATNGGPNIAPSPSSILGPPLNPGPMVNQQSVLSDTLFPSDFMQHLSNSLEDFETNMFRPDSDINFERDFGQWFSPDDSIQDVQVEMK